MDILFDCRCSCNCSVRLRWVSVIYMAGSQNAFTMCGCVYPYSKHRDVDNNWHGADPMWITFFHIWIRELFFEKRALALFFLCTKMCQIKKSLKIMSEFKTPNPVYMEGKEKSLWFEKNPNMKEVHCSSDCTLKTKGADTSWLTGLPVLFMTGSCRRRLRIGYRKSEAYNETTRKVQDLCRNRGLWLLILQPGHLKWWQSDVYVQTSQNANTIFPIL